MTSKTPADLEILPRDVAFGRNETFERWWLGNDPVATAFYNSLSVTFPQGERFFIEAVRHYKDRAPKELQAQIKAFTAQESIHSREHIAFNRQVTDHGYDISMMEERERKLIEMDKRFPPAMQLAATAALEHFTAIMAHAVLSNPKHMEGAKPEAARLWRWHAMEEIEHKAVAYDTYLATVKGGPIGRYLMRVWVMFDVTIMFNVEIGLNIRDFFKQDGINKASHWWRLVKYLWGKPGLFRECAGAYFRYYLPGFHPWRIDDRDLLAEVRADLAQAA